MGDMWMHQESPKYREMEGSDAHEWFRPGDLVSHKGTEQTGEIVVDAEEPGHHWVEWDDEPGEPRKHFEGELKMDIPRNRRYEWEKSRPGDDPYVPFRLTGHLANRAAEMDPKLAFLVDEHPQSEGEGLEKEAWGGWRSGNGSGWGHYDGAGLSPIPPLSGPSAGEAEDPLETFWLAYLQSTGEEGIDLNAWLQFVYEHNIPLEDSEAIQFFDDHAQKEA